MTTRPIVAGAPPAPKSLVARLIGVVTAPRGTFGSVAASPKWFGMLAVTAVLMAFFAALPMTTAGGRQAAIDVADAQMRSLQKMGIQVDADKMHDQMEKTAGQLPYRNGGGVLVFAPIVALVLAGILFAVFNAGLGGDASFKQVFAVVVHAGAISMLALAFSGTINFFRETLDSSTNLGTLVPFMSQDSFVVYLLGAIDLFRIWWVLVLSIGLAVLYRRRTQPIAMSLLSVYAVIAIAVALFKSRAGGA